LVPVFLWWLTLCARETLMTSQSQEPEIECKELTEEQKARASAAEAAYCKACEEKGIKVCTWEEFDAWQKFVDGKINEKQLEVEAGIELDQHSKTFGKYLVMEKVEPRDNQDEPKKKRARQANQIYKKVCEDRDVNLCFFSNFATWSEYVEGRMSDGEFYEKANQELDKVKEGEA